MTRIPLGDTGYDTEKVPVELVDRFRDVLLFDFGDGPQRFLIDNIAFKSTQQSPGEFVTVYTLTLSLQDAGGPPQIAERPAGTEVARLVRSSNTSSNT